MTKIEVGKKYENGFGAIIKIVSAPNSKNRWFEDEMGNRYHDTGEMVRMSSTPEYNLVLQHLEKWDLDV